MGERRNQGNASDLSTWAYIREQTDHFAKRAS